MKRIATAAFAICLLSGTSALAQPDHHDKGDHDNGGQHNNNGGQHNNGGQQQHFNPQSFQHSFGPQGVQGAPQHNNPQVYRYQGQTQFYGQHNQGSQNNPQVYQHHFQGTQNFHPQFGAPGFHPGGQRPHYAPQFFPRVFHPESRFEWRGGFWRGPPGWYYHSWFYGQFLPYGWFGSPWWINDYWYYDLPVPPYGYEWIRNGPDALLVNVDTGMIVEVVPGIFY